MWQDYAIAFLGLCVLVVAFLDLSGTTLTWTLGVLGVAILALALGNAVALLSSGSRSAGRQQHA